MKSKIITKWPEIDFSKIIKGKPRHGVYKPKEFFGKGIKIVKMGTHMKNDFIFDDKIPDLIELTASEIQRYQTYENDLLFLRTSLVMKGTGKCSIVKKLNQPMVFVSNLIAISLDLLKANPLFYYYYFSSKRGRNNVLALCEQTAAATIRSSDLSNLKTPYPPLEVQNRISSILESLDQQILVCQRQNEIIELTIQTIFKSWFIEFDGQKDFVDSELGKIPEGWSLGMLSELAYNIKNSVKPSEITPETAYIGLEHMPRDSIALSKWEKAECLQSNKSQFKTSQILFGKLRPYFKKVGIAPVNGVCSTDILVIDSKIPESFGYVLGILTSDNFINYTDMSSTGTKMPRTDWKIMKDYSIIIPPREIISEYNKLVSNFVKNIRKNIFEIIKLQTMKDTLLPKLMSGEI